MRKLLKLPLKKTEACGWNVTLDDSPPGSVHDYVVSFAPILVEDEPYGRVQINQPTHLCPHLRTIYGILKEFYKTLSGAMV